MTNQILRTTASTAVASVAILGVLGVMERMTLQKRSTIVDVLEVARQPKTINQIQDKTGRPAGQIRRSLQVARSLSLAIVVDRRGPNGEWRWQTTSKGLKTLKAL